VDRRRGGVRRTRLPHLGASHPALHVSDATVQVVRSSPLVRTWIAGFFVACGAGFAFAAVSKTPGSSGSQWAGHVLFALGACACAFLAVRGVLSGRLVTGPDECRWTSILRSHRIRSSEIASVEASSDWCSYSVAPVVHLASGRSIRLPDFGSASWTYRRRPSDCACGRAVTALKRAAT
jgi:hypothetical protein